MTLLPFELDQCDIHQDTVDTFLQRLNGPRYFVLDGKDNSRTRFFITLLHGNEPSGVMALLRWLQNYFTPAVRIVCVVASVKTALGPPLFHYRTMPGVRDLNRCFQAPFDDEPGQLAEQILNLIHRYQPEAVIDVHNTSGSGPAFGVATHDDEQHHALTALFSDQLVITHLKLGALMDISEEYYPTVTIEAGGRLDQKAHDTAWNGLLNYITRTDLFRGHYPPINMIVEPIRVELNAGTNLTYATTANAEFDVTLLDNIDRFNFVNIGPNTQLGWVNRGTLDHFIVSDCKYNSHINDWLRIEDGGKLYPANRATLFMITTNPVIATEDCLFYAVKASKPISV